jgi:hypothetical protein
MREQPDTRVAVAGVRLNLGPADPIDQVEKHRRQLP